MKGGKPGVSRAPRSRPKIDRFPPLLVQLECAALDGLEWMLLEVLLVLVLAALLGGCEFPNEGEIPPPPEGIADTCVGKWWCDPDTGICRCSGWARPVTDGAT